MWTRIHDFRIVMNCKLQLVSKVNKMHDHGFLSFPLAHPAPVCRILKTEVWYLMDDEKAPSLCKPYQIHNKYLSFSDVVLWSTVVLVCSLEISRYKTSLSLLVDSGEVTLPCFFIISGCSFLFLSWIRSRTRTITNKELFERVPISILACNIIYHEGENSTRDLHHIRIALWFVLI
jgi:hypothetical protein